MKNAIKQQFIDRIPPAYRPNYVLDPAGNPNIRSILQRGIIISRCVSVHDNA
jgi:hypothetical protein